MIFVILAIVIVLIIISMGSNEQPNNTAPPDPLDNPSPNSPEKIITFIGATSTGKSSTINALLGKSIRPVAAGHGTTRAIEQVEYKKAYYLCDTPGLMDQFKLVSDTKLVINKSEIVIYVCVGQLYREELELLEKIYNFQRKSNQTKPTRTRKLILYVNKRDLSHKTMSPSSLSKEKELIRSQVSNYIEEKYIVYGSASPFNQDADIKQLQTIVDSFLV